MNRKRKAPALAEREGFECHLLAGGDNEASTVKTARTQFLVRAGLSMDRAALLASLAFGEVPA